MTKKDENLMLMLTKRVTDLEKLVNAQRLELKEKNHVNASLSNEILELKKIIGEGSQKKIESLQQESVNKDKKLKELESFLKQYNLIVKTTESGYEFNHGGIRDMEKEYFDEKSK